MATQRFGALLVVAGGLLSLIGCTTAVEISPDIDKIKPKLALREGGFRVVRTLTGRASCPYLLFLDLPALNQIGLSYNPPAIAFAIGDAGLRVRAMEDLHAQHDMLGKPQVLHHFVEEWSRANYLGLFAIQRLTISAELIEFIEAPD